MLYDDITLPIGTQLDVKISLNHQIRHYRFSMNDLPNTLYRFQYFDNNNINGSYVMNEIEDEETYFKEFDALLNEVKQLDLNIFINDNDSLLNKELVPVESIIRVCRDGIYLDNKDINKSDAFYDTSMNAVYLKDYKNLNDDLLKLKDGNIINLNQFDNNYFFMPLQLGPSEKPAYFVNDNIKIDLKAKQIGFMVAGDWFDLFEANPIHPNQNIKDYQNKTLSNKNKILIEKIKNARINDDVIFDYETLSNKEILELLKIMNWCRSIFLVWYNTFETSKKLNINDFKTWNQDGLKTLTFILETDYDKINYETILKKYPDIGDGNLKVAKPQGMKITKQEQKEEIKLRR